MEGIEFLILVQDSHHLNILWGSSTRADTQIMFQLKKNPQTYLLCCSRLSLKTRARRLLEGGSADSLHCSGGASKIPAPSRTSDQLKLRASGVDPARAPQVTSMHSQGRALPPALMEGAQQPPGTEHVIFCPNYSAPGISGPLLLSREPVLGFAFPAHSIIFLFRVSSQRKGPDPGQLLGSGASNPAGATGRSVSWGHWECFSVGGS